MSKSQNEELDKFKRRLIRTVSRYKEQNVPDLWDAVEKAMGKDCKSMWEHMRTITLKKLARLIASGDIPERLAPVARMTLTDWLFLDMVLVHDQIDVIEMDRPADELRPLRDLFALVQAFNIEESPREQLAQRWSAATLHYNKQGHQCSPMLLQKRWHQLKSSTRAHFYHYLNYGRKIVKQGKEVKIRPCELHVLIARKYPDIVTKKLMTWEEMMSQNLLALPHELEENLKMQKSSSVSETNEPDLILMEPQVETIDIDDDSSDELPSENFLLPPSESDSVETNELVDPTYSAEINTNCTRIQTPTNKKPNSNSYSSDLAEMSKQSDASASNISCSKTYVDAELSLTSPPAVLPPQVTENSTEILPAHVTEDSTEILPAQVTEDSTEILPAQVTEDSTEILPAQVTEDSTEISPAQVTVNSTKIPTHPAVPNVVYTKADLQYEVPVEFERCSDKSLLTNQTLVGPNVSPESLSNLDILSTENKAKLSSNVEKVNENNLPKPKTNKNSSLNMEQCKPQLMEINDSDRSLIGKRLILPPAVLRASKRPESLCSRLNVASSKTDNVMKYPEVSVSSVKSKTDSIIELDSLRIKKSVSDLTIETADKSVSSANASNKNCPATVIDKSVLRQDSIACLPQSSKVEITIESMQNDPSKLNSGKISNPLGDKLETVHKEFDEIEFIDGCVEAINIDEATLKSLEEQNKRIYTIEKKESPAESEDDQRDKKTPNFDLKLLMQPIVYTTKIDDIEVLKNILSEQTICLENIENFILSQTKPQVKNSCKYFKEKLKSFNLSGNNFVDKVVNDDRVLDDIIQLNSALANNYALVKQETEIEVNQEITCSPTFRNEDYNTEVFDISHQMFKKPIYRTYTPIALCKHPDFNTRLKRLPVTFFLSPSNRQYLKTCKPLTIDLSKEFERKMIEGVMHVKSSFQTSAKPIDSVNIVQTVSLTPVTQVAETAFENMPPDMIHSPEFTDTNNLLTQRKKPIELPDIEKVRAVNSHLKTAQVPPLQVIMKGTVDNTKVRPQKRFSADADVTYGGNVKLYCTNKGEVTFASTEKTMPINATTTTYQPLKNRRPRANVPYLAKKHTKLEECFITNDTLGKIFAELGYPEMQTGQFVKKKTKLKSKNRADNTEEHSAAPNFCCWIAQEAIAGPNVKDTKKHEFYCLEECTCCCKDKIFNGPKIDLIQSEKEIEDAVAGISNISTSKTPETLQVAVKVHHASPKTARKKITVICKNITRGDTKNVLEQKNTPLCTNKTSKALEITSENYSLITNSQETCEPLAEQIEILPGEDKKIEKNPHEIEETIKEKTLMPVSRLSAEIQNKKNTQLFTSSDIVESKSKVINEQIKIVCHSSPNRLDRPTINESNLKINNGADKATDDQQREMYKETSHSIDPSENIDTLTKTPESEERLDHPTNHKSCMKMNEDADNANDGTENEKCENTSLRMNTSENIDTLTKTPESEERLDHPTNHKSCMKMNEDADNANDGTENEKCENTSLRMNTSKKIETTDKPDIIDLCDEEDNKIVDKRRKTRRTNKRKLEAQLQHEKQVQEWQAVKKQSRTAFGFSPDSPVKTYTRKCFKVLDSNDSNIKSTHNNINSINTVIPDNVNADEEQQIIITGKETFIIRHCKSRIPLSLGESRILLTTANLISPPATSFIAPQDTSIVSSSNKKFAGQIIMDSNVCNVPQGTKIVILPTGQVTAVIEEDSEELTENQIKILQELVKITQSQVDNGLIEIPKVKEVESNLNDIPKSLFKLQSEDDNDLLEIPKENQVTNMLPNRQVSLLKSSYTRNPPTIVIDDGDETNVQEKASLDSTKDETTLGPEQLSTKENSIPIHFEGVSLESADQKTINRNQSKQMRNLQTEVESSPNDSKNDRSIMSQLEHEPTNKSNETDVTTPVECSVNNVMDKNESISPTNDHNYATVSKATQMIKSNDFASLAENYTFEKPKNILSDLMEISGITNEDSTDVSEMQPEVCMPKISNVSIVATYLTPITSVAELHQSNVQNGKFYVYNFNTEVLANINVMHVNQTSLNPDEGKMLTLEVNPLPNNKEPQPLPKLQSNQVTSQAITSTERRKNPRKEKIDTRIEISDSDEPMIEEHLVSSDESDTDLPDEVKKKVERLLQRYKYFKSRPRPKPYPIEIDYDSDSDDEPLSVVALKKMRPRKRKKVTSSDNESPDKTKKRIDQMSKVNENMSAAVGHEEVSIIESDSENIAITHKENVYLKSQLDADKYKVYGNKKRLEEKKNSKILHYKFKSTDSPIAIDKNVDININCSQSESVESILGM